MADVPPKKDIVRLEHFEEVPAMRSPQTEPPTSLQDPERLSNHGLRVLWMEVLDQIRAQHEIEAIRLEACFSRIGTKERHTVDRADAAKNGPGAEAPRQPGRS